MEIIYFIVILIAILIFWMFLSVNKVKNIFQSHRLAHTTKIVNDGKFNELITREASDEKIRDLLRPIINIDDKSLKSIVFMNNVNYMAWGLNGDVLFNLNMRAGEEDTTHYHFMTPNYDIGGGQDIVRNMVWNNFPKAFNNDKTHYSILSLEDLGFKGKATIKADQIVALHFDGKKKVLTILSNNSKRTSYTIKYKSKKEMIKKIKETTLYDHIMQWGMGGYKNSQLMWVEKGAN